MVSERPRLRLGAARSAKVLVRYWTMSCDMWITTGLVSTRGKSIPDELRRGTCTAERP